MARRFAALTGSRAKRIAIGLGGGLVTIAGLAMLALPGPGLVVLFVGLSILAGEFVWARRLKRRVERESDQALKALSRRRARRERRAAERRARQERGPRVDVPQDRTPDRPRVDERPPHHPSRAEEEIRDDPDRPALT